MGQHEDMIAPFIAAIDEVRAERDRLREALTLIEANSHGPDYGPHVMQSINAFARSALSPESNPETGER